MIDTTCTPINASAVDGDPTAAVNAACAAPTPTVTGSVVFTEYAQGCTGGTAPGACTSGVCVPSGNAVCVWQAGTPTCPNGYPVATTVYGGLNDGRSCTPCTCGTTTPGTCQSTVNLYAAADCSGGPAMMKLSGVGPNCQNDPSCLVFGAPIMSAVLSPGSPSPATCGSPAGGTLTGKATGTKPTTVCCTN
jgi:hypothetical protein